MNSSGLRELIPAAEQMTYLNTGWNGPSPTPVVDAIKRRLDFENENGPTSPEVRESGAVIRDESRAAVAELVNADPSEILLTENTTDGINVVMTGLPWREGDEIITCSLEHASILVPSYYTQYTNGTNVKVLQLDPAETYESVLDKVSAAMTDRTRMVFLSHIEFSSGVRMPIKAISEITRPRGIWLLVDGAQGAGHVRVDVNDLGCDFYAMSGQKWLLGPDGTGALYIRSEMIPTVRAVRVSSHAVTSHDHAGNYEIKVDDIDKYVVSTASLALRAGFLEAVRIHLAAGPETIEAHNLELASELKAALVNMPGIRVLSPLEGPECAGLVTFYVEGADQPLAAESLWEADRVLVRSVPHPSGIRASMHFFNTKEDAQRLASALRGVVP